MEKYFTLAKKAALKSDIDRHYLFGACGVRKDGKIVISRNVINKGKDVHCHAEGRLSRKLDAGSIVYVVRVCKTTGKLMPARPCIHCQRMLRFKSVKKVYYSLTNDEFGTLLLE